MLENSFFVAMNCRPRIICCVLSDTATTENRAELNLSLFVQMKLVIKWSLNSNKKCIVIDYSSDEISLLFVWEKSARKNLWWNLRFKMYFLLYHTTSIICRLNLPWAMIFSLTTRVSLKHEYFMKLHTTASIISCNNIVAI